ncbi:DUF333 domain-containing protein [Vibrio makurazakiensis]|uniref:putative hemolysin n=1 Tax=Vibrio makurazakiensis TaxID=2910250 RepID=UPI003D10E758
MVLVGCASEPTQEVDGETKKVVMMANPAAVYCVQQSGALETVTENEKRVTYCVLSEEERVEQWEYFNKNHKEKEES